MNQKITFPELIELMARKQKCSKREAEAFLRELMTMMTDVVSSGESLRINSLGIFKPVWVEERVSVNVQSGEPYTIPGHYKLTFTPTKAVREAVNEPFSCFSVEVLSDDAPCIAEAQLPEDEPTDDVIEVVDITPQAQQPENEVEICDEKGDETGDKVVEEKLSDEVSTEPSCDNETTISSEELAVVEPQNSIEEEPQNLSSVETVETTAPAEVQSVTPIEPQAPVTVELETVEEDIEKIDEIVKKAYRRGVWIGVGVAVLIVVLLALGLYFYKISSNRISNELPVVHHPVVVDTVAEEAAPLDTLTIANMPQDSLPVVADAPAVVVTDTVERGVFLTNISFRHYGHKAFWVYIYEENRHIIANPDQVPAGTVVVIPPAQKYGIDATDTVAINKALKIADEIKLRNK